MKKKLFLFFALILVFCTSVSKGAVVEYDYAIWSVMYTEGMTRTLFIFTVSVNQTDDEFKPKIISLKRSCPTVSATRVSSLGAFPFDCSNVASNCSATIALAGFEAHFGFNYNFALVITAPDWGQEPRGGYKTVRVVPDRGIF